VFIAYTMHVSSPKFEHQLKAFMPLWPWLGLRALAMSTLVETPLLATEAPLPPCLSALKPATVAISLI